MASIKWHPSFCGGLELRLRAYRDILDIRHEQDITKMPITADTIVVVLKENVQIKEDIAQLFLKYNIIEYKSPGDALSIDEYYNLICYMARFKASTGATNAVKATEVTGTLMRDTKPVKLFRDIIELGGAINRVFPGIYYITGIINMPTQIIVQSELANDDNAVFRILSNRGRREDIALFTERARTYTDKQDRNNVDIVLQASVAANRDQYEALRREDPAVCEALRDLMRDELIAGSQRAREEGLREGREEGRSIGENRLASLIEALLKLGRSADVAKVASDPVYRERLYKEFKLA